MWQTMLQQKNKIISNISKSHWKGKYIAFYVEYVLCKTQHVGKAEISFNLQFKNEKPKRVNRNAFLGMSELIETLIDTNKLKEGS